MYLARSVSGHPFDAKKSGLRVHRWAEEMIDVVDWGLAGVEQCRCLPFLVKIDISGYGGFLLFWEVSGDSFLS